VASGESRTHRGIRKGDGPESEDRVFKYGFYDWCFGQLVVMYARPIGRRWVRMGR
jgi:hypothetical protein